MQAELRPCESLELARRRAGLTQQQFADLLGVSPDRVRRWENALSCPVPAPRMPQSVVLESHEWVWLQRRRAGITLQELSDQMGLSVSWIARAERGEFPADRIGALAIWWESKR